MSDDEAESALLAIAAPLNWHPLDADDVSGDIVRASTEKGLYRLRPNYSDPTHVSYFALFVKNDGSLSYTEGLFYSVDIVKSLCAGHAITGHW